MPEASPLLSLGPSLPGDRVSRGMGFTVLKAGTSQANEDRLVALLMTTFPNLHNIPGPKGI